MCFVVFCGCLDVLRVVCGGLQVFCSISTKHPKNIEKLWKTRKTHNTLVYCGRFPRAKKIDCIAENTFHKTSAKHRKTLQNSHKTRFVKLRRKTPQNKRKTLKTVCFQNCHKTVAIHPQYVLRAFDRCLPKNTLDLLRKHTIRNIRVNYGWGGVTYPQGAT